MPACTEYQWGLEKAALLCVLSLQLTTATETGGKGSRKMSIIEAAVTADADDGSSYAHLNALVFFSPK